VSSFSAGIAGENRQQFQPNCHPKFGPKLSTICRQIGGELPGNF